MLRLQMDESGSSLEKGPLFRLADILIRVSSSQQLRAMPPHALRLFFMAVRGMRGSPQSIKCVYGVIIVLLSCPWTLAIESNHGANQTNRVFSCTPKMVIREDHGCQWQLWVG